MLAKIRKFRRFLGPEVWRRFLFAVCIGLMWFAVESSFAYVLQGFLSTLGLIPGVNLGRIAELYPTGVVASVLVLIGFGFFRSLVVFLRFHTANTTTQAFVFFQRARILKFSLENAQATNTTDAVTLFNDRVTESGKVIQNFVSIINLSTAIALFSLFCLYITPIEFLIGMFILAIALAPIRRLNKVVGVASLGIVEESRKVTHSLLVGLRNNFLLRIYDEVGPVIATGVASLRRYQNHFRRYSVIYCLNGAFPHFVGTFAVAIVTLVSLKYLHTPAGSLLVFFYLFFRIATAASETSALLNESRVYFESMRMLVRFSERVDELQLVAKPQKGSVVTAVDSIEASNLGFQWPSGTRVIANQNVSVRRGELLLIKGESGSGKSTLLSLLTGLLVPTSGEIRYNGLPIGEVDLSKVSDQIGYVGPESFMIEGSLRENLLFANDHFARVADPDILKALTAVRLDAELAKSGLGLDSHLNEFTQLSTGQKQRLALARALLRDPRILILDEATANLDAETERRLLDSLTALKQSMITIAVSHRDSFDALADVRVELQPTAQLL